MTAGSRFPFSLGTGGCGFLMMAASATGEGTAETCDGWLFMSEWGLGTQFTPLSAYAPRTGLRFE
jgi:hypothetical protein